MRLALLRGGKAKRGVAVSPVAVHCVPTPEAPSRSEIWCKLIAWSKEHALGAGLSRGFRPTCNPNRFHERPARMVCLCSGFLDTKGNRPRCGVELCASYDANSGGVLFKAMGQHSAAQLKAKEDYSFHPDYTTMRVVAKQPTRGEPTQKALKQWAQGMALSEETNGGKEPFDLTVAPAGIDAKLSGGRIRVAMQCTSCPLAETLAPTEKKCSVRAFAVCQDKTTILYMEGSHADRQCKKYGTATTGQRVRLHRAKAKQVSGKLKTLNHLAASPPSKEQAKNMIKNRAYQSRKRAAPAGAAQADDRRWAVDDIREALAAEGLTLPSRIHDPNIGRDELVLLDEVVLPAQGGAKKAVYAAVLSTKEILDTHLRLKNQEFVKVATDATFDEVMDDFCTIPVGVLSKNYAETTFSDGARLKGYTTHFNPMLWVLASGEPSEAVGAGLSCAGERRGHDGRPLRKRIRQMHADWGSGIEKARREQLPDSVRAADYRHTFKAIEEGLTEKLNQKDKEGKPVHFRECLNAIQYSRTHCTMLAEFHLFWSNFFTQMESSWKERIAATYLKTTFFFELSPAEAKNQYGLTGLSRGEKALCAAWWGSYERLQPGSLGGSQSFETEHAHDFRGTFVDEDGKPLRRLTPRQFVAALRETALYKGRQLRKLRSDLVDVPAGPCPCSRSSGRLAQYGRSSAVDFFQRWGGGSSCVIRVVTLATGARATVMPRTLLWKPASADGFVPKEWEAIPAETLATSACEAELIAKMAIERDLRTLRSLWEECGIVVTRAAGGAIFQFKQWRRLRYHRIVVLDPATSAMFWRSPDPRFRVCSCLPFGLAGRCEHEQCVQGMEHDGSCLDTPGERLATGRPSALQPSHAVRGVSMRTAMRLAEKRSSTAKLARRSRRRAMRVGLSLAVQLFARGWFRAAVTGGPSDAQPLPSRRPLPRPRARIQVPAYHVRIARFGQCWKY